MAWIRVVRLEKDGQVVYITREGDVDEGEEIGRVAKDRAKGRNTGRTLPQQRAIFMRKASKATAVLNDKSDHDDEGDS